MLRLFGYRKSRFFRKRYPKFNGRTQFKVFRLRGSIRYNKTVKGFHKYLRSKFK